MRVERFPAQEVYDAAARDIGDYLTAGQDVAVLCEGDPFFYGSFMYLYERLAGEFDCEIVPGVSSMMAGAAALKRPLADAIAARLEQADAIAIIKIGRHFARIKSLLEKHDLVTCAGYLERISLADERIMPLGAAEGDAPYFSMILIYKGSENWVARLPVEASGSRRDTAQAKPASKQDC